MQYLNCGSDRVGGSLVAVRGGLGVSLFGLLSGYRPSGSTVDGGLGALLFASHLITWVQVDSGLGSPLFGQHSEYRPPWSTVGGELGLLLFAPCLIPLGAVITFDAD